MKFWEWERPFSQVRASASRLFFVFSRFFIPPKRVPKAFGIGTGLLNLHRKNAIGNRLSPKRVKFQMERQNGRMGFKPRYATLVIKNVPSLPNGAPEIIIGGRRAKEIHINVLLQLLQYLSKLSCQPD